MAGAGKSVTLAEVFRANNAALKAGIHTSLPGVIKSYDPETKLADVLPVIKAPKFDPETGETMESEELPVIPNVPVQFPRGGGWHMSFPLEEGDHVTLVFSESATGAWRTSGEVSEPGDVRRHALGYPSAFLGAHPDDDVLADDAATSTLTAGKMVIGRDGNPKAQIRIEHVDAPPGGFVECGGDTPEFLAKATGTVAALTALKNAVGPLLGPGQAAFDTAMDAAIAQVTATVTKGQ